MERGVRNSSPDFWKITNSADLIEINSKKPENPYYYQYTPTDKRVLRRTELLFLSNQAPPKTFV